MTTLQLRQLLLNRPSYLKKSALYLSQKTGLSVQTCQKTLDEIKSKSNNGLNPDNVLVIGDLHEPFTLAGYLAFCKHVQQTFNCGKVVFIGDLVDNHFTSYHEIDPDSFGAKQELEFARYKLEAWHKSFPKAYVCRGNHDVLVARKAFSSGIASSWIRSENEVFDTPTWNWVDEIVLQNVLYIHGTGFSGANAAITIAKERGLSTVMGHLHTFSSVQYLSRKTPTFGMLVGCGIDHSKYAFKYAKYFSRKPIISCGVVLNGKQAFVINYEDYTLIDSVSTRITGSNKL